jgi:hypothetical protein
VYFGEGEFGTAQEFGEEVEQDGEAETKRIHYHDAVPDQFEFENVGVLLPVVEVAGQVARGAEQKDDGGEQPKGTIEVGVVAK